MLHLLITAIPFAAGVTIALLAAWRRWAPPLGVALAAGTALRLFIAVISWRDSWQPPDFMYQFTDAIRAVLRHQDPLRLPNSEWHFLPAMAYVNTGAYRLGELTHVPWQLIGRVVPVGADIVLIALVGALAGTGERRRMASLQYALNPLPIMICAIHGQVEPVASALGVGALLLALRQPAAGSRERSAARSFHRRQQLAGAAHPWRAARAHGLAQRLHRAGMGMRGPAGVLHHRPHHHRLSRSLPRAATCTRWLTPRGVIGDWGWTALVTGGHQEIRPSVGAAGNGHTPGRPCRYLVPVAPGAPGGPHRRDEPRLPRQL